MTQRGVPTRQRNTTLRAVRMSLGWSQQDMARALEHAGIEYATKQLVQRWESGRVRDPQPRHRIALERITGLPAAQLGFDVPYRPDPRPDGRGGHDLTTQTPPLPVGATSPRYTGIWLLRYEYYSSSRGKSYTCTCHAVVIHHGERGDGQLTVRSLPWPGSSSTITMTLSVEDRVVTGTWVEQTEKDGYYRGARYHGAVQMAVDPTGRRMAGKWVGFGRDGDINTGPWDLSFVDPSVSRETLDRYSIKPGS